MDRNGCHLTIILASSRIDKTYFILASFEKLKIKNTDLPTLVDNCFGQLEQIQIVNKGFKPKISYFVVL